MNRNMTINVTRNDSRSKTLLLIICMLCGMAGEAWATYTYRLLNSSNVEVAYCTNTVNTLPGDMTSPLVASYNYYPTQADAENGTNGEAGSTTAADGSTVWVKYTLTAEATELFSGKEYKIYSNTKTDYVAFANGGNVGAWGAQSSGNNLWIIEGDPYSMKIKVADAATNNASDRGKYISVANNTNGEQFHVSSSDSKRSTLMAVRAKNDATKILLRVNDTESEYVSGTGSYLDNGNPFKIWREAGKWADGKLDGLWFRFEDPYKIDVTYHIMKAANSEVTKMKVTEDYTNTPSLPSGLTSPLVGAYTYYKDAACTNLYSASEQIALSNTNTDVFVRYTANSVLDLSGAAYYYMIVNEEYATQDGTSLKMEGTNTKGDNYRWYLEAGGDPYQVRLRNNEGYYLHYDSATGEAPVTLKSVEDDNPTSYYFVKAGNTTGKYELVAVTEDITSNFYTLHDNTRNSLKLSANTTATADVQVQFEGVSATFTFKVIDHSGAEVISDNVTVSAGQLLADAMPSSIKSPLATDWRFYTDEDYATTDASSNGGTRTGAVTSFDAETIETWGGAKTVYARYSTSASVDLNGRSSGTMYLLKFLSGSSFLQEDGHDGVNATDTKAVYPYNNGDYNLYVYGEEQWTAAQQGAASTRTRYPWYFESANNDPYHVKIGSYQLQSKVGEIERHAYLRTYAVSYGSPSATHIVTGAITDNTVDINDGSAPSEYMILGTTGEYLLKTVASINGEQRTVDSFEQYWKNNPTVQRKAGLAEDSGEPSAAQKNSLPANWHSYQAWANAEPWSGGDKVFNKGEHWFQTVSMGNGTFDIVPVELDGALILLDNHGWEVMRMPIVKSGSSREAEVRNALKKYDSPMVKRYNFYTDTKSKTKVSGYHKYDIQYHLGLGTAGVAEVEPGSTITTLAGYPESLDASGTIYDLYVTYEVKDEYKNLPAVALKQGDSQFVSTTDGTDLTFTATAAEAKRWTLKPNADIDTELGYTEDAISYTEAQNGFDPYNIQVQSVDYATRYIQTNATTATLANNEWSGDGSALTLNTLATRITPQGHDNKTLALTNATFMAVQDASSNMRMMPRFDNEQVWDYNSGLTLADNVDAKASQKTTVHIPVTFHLMRSGTTFEGATVDGGIQEVGALLVSGSLPDRSLWSDRLNCTLDPTHYYSDAACTQEISTIVGGDIYIPYTFDAATLQANTKVVFSDDYEHAKWMALEFDSHPNYYLNYVNASSDNITRNYAASTSDVAADDKYYFAFIGDPYKFRIVNKAAGDSKDAQKGATVSASVDNIDFTDGTDHDIWSMLAPSGGGTDKFQILLTSTNLATRYYWNHHGSQTATAILYYATGDANNLKATRLKGEPFVTITAPSTEVAKDATLSLTATAVLNGGEAITHMEIQLSDGAGGYTMVAGADNAATVSYDFTPTAYGTYSFRAMAVTDGEATLTGYTDTDFTVSVAPTPKKAAYELQLIDNEGHVVFTEVVTADQVHNSIGDPLSYDKRSPLVSKYKYYEGTSAGKASATANDDSNLVDWATYGDDDEAVTDVVYVGYESSTAYDLDGSENRSVDGKMYLLKFINGEEFYQEKSDEVMKTMSKAVYPYNNGDAGLYIYSSQKLSDQQNEGNSTKTRWPWYLEGGDPYRLRISSLQSQTSTTTTMGDVTTTTQHYAYLRTYQPEGYDRIVTGVITDNPVVTNTDSVGGNAANVPTDYMVLYGTDGHMKLVTAEPVSLDINGDGYTVDEGESAERRAVTSFEQYWKNNPTVNGLFDAAGCKITDTETYADYLPGNTPLTPAREAVLTAHGWHTYKAWANGAPWAGWKTDNTGTSKQYKYKTHTFQTVDMDNGDFDLEEIELDGALILLDQHGWEVVRRPISMRSSDKAALREALKAFDSPMVKTYHFWINWAKESGYRKYHPISTYSAAKDLKKNATYLGSGTSLSDYPEGSVTNGVLNDIFVTYELKDEYAHSYVGAATESGTVASKFYVRQGTSYAKTTDGATITTQTGTTGGNELLWYLKPNFNIDREMDYHYADDDPAGQYGELTHEDTEAGYLAGQQYLDYTTATPTVIYTTTYGRNSFDPYNLQIESVSQSGKLFTTNATDARLDGTGGMRSTYGSGTMTVTLAEYNASGFAVSDYWDIGAGYQIPHVTNQTFMAIQDGNGNMRLMPRFDHSHVVEGLTVLSAQAAAQTAADESHSQTTLLVRKPVTYHVIDLAGETVFSNIPGMKPGVELTHSYQSPMVDEYYYHKSEAHAKAEATRNETDADGTESDIYVTYTVKPAFQGTNAWAVYGASGDGSGMYMHAKFNESAYNNNNAQWWQMTSQHQDISGPTAVSTATMPFLDGSYVWQFGADADPYDARFMNQGAQRYIRKNGEQMDFLTTDRTQAIRYAILYADNDETNPSAVLYDRDNSVYNKWDTSNKDWRFDASRTNASALTITQLPELAINIVDAAGSVETSIQGYYKSGATWTPFVPYYLKRAYTSGQAFYYNQAGTSPVSGTVSDETILTTNGGAVFVKYDLAADWGTLDTEHADITQVKPYAAGDPKINWYLLRPNADDNDILMAVGGHTPAVVNRLNAARTTITAAPEDATSMHGQWAFTGTPYSLKILNRAFGPKAYLGIADGLASYHLAPLSVYDKDAAAITTWELTTGWGSSAKLFFRPQGSMSGQSPHVYFGWSTGGASISTQHSMSAEVAHDVTYVTQTDPFSTVSIASDLALGAKAVVDANTVITATATPKPAANTVMSLVIEQQDALGNWVPVSAEYTGKLLDGMTYDPSTHVVTVSYDFTPERATTYSFRARAVINGFTQYSTDHQLEGGQGSPLEIEATTATFECKSDIARLILVDKKGATLYTESGVSKDRVNTENTISHRSGDPLSNEWRSPLVRRYFYYTTVLDAANNSKKNLVDWDAYAGATVYVGYETDTEVALNSSGFSTLKDLMENRVLRSGTTTNMVRDASKFGTMYMLKFQMSEAAYLEDGSDDVEESATPASTYVYPYTNGDGPMYIYTDARYRSQIDNGASTRTRWPWFLVSPTGDPYHVVVTSWQNAHSRKEGDITTNYYSYFRTYYNSTLGRVITGNVTDDPRTLDGEDQIMPSEYMVLYGSSAGIADGRGFRLKTTAEVNGAHQTVTSLEQYWRNNPTALYKKARAAKGSALTADEKNALKTGHAALATDDAALTTNGWHNYAAYVNATPWEGGSKTYKSGDHWFQTISLGDGSFSLDEADINGVLVLLDNHGWEIMRHTIVAHDDANYPSVQAALRQWDSPMVSQYKFYGSRNVNHKVPGYHKYNVLHGIGTVLKESDRVEPDKAFTSLADYPVKMNSGAMMDLYVTYDVKESYASCYTPDTEGDGPGTSAAFMVRQGAAFAVADGSSITTTDTKNWSNEAMLWYLKPNFDIDVEQGYKYDVKVNATDADAVTRAATDADYHTNGQDGFDPYNIQIVSKSAGTLMTTNATGGELVGSTMRATYPASTAVTLAAAKTMATYAEGESGAAYRPVWHDSQQLNVSNQTFMVIDDGNGNMRLMPRFDHEHVMQSFATIEPQADAQPKYDAAHGQSTLFTTGSTTFHVIDLSDNDVFGEITIADNVGYTLPRMYKSPFADQYFYHKTQEHATTAATRNVSDAKIGDATIYVTYTVKDVFKGNSAWNVYGANNVYLHANYKPVEDRLFENRYQGKWWWVNEQNKGRIGGYDFYTTTLPFIDNTFAWQFGDSPDPYAVKLFNKGAQTYVTGFSDGDNSWTLDFLVPSGTHDDGTNKVYQYAILNYEEDEDNKYSILFEREHKRYGMYDSSVNRWRTNQTERVESGQMMFTQLPQIDINIVNADQEVEATLEGYYMSGCSWQVGFVPYYLQRACTQNHTLYYTLADAQARENMISGPIDESKMQSAVYVRYDLTAGWSTVTTDALTTDVMPSPYGGKMQWYAIQAGNSDSDDHYFKVDASATYSGQTDLLYHDGKTTAVTADPVDDETLLNSIKRMQFAILGTPYSMRIINRYYGTDKYLGIPADPDNHAIDPITTGIGTSTRARMYGEDEGDCLTTWEVVTGLGSSVAAQGRLYIRPQGSFNGEAPLRYLGYDGGHTRIDADRILYGLKLWWVKETDATMVTFKLYDSDGKQMAYVPDARRLEVQAGDDLRTDHFDKTAMPRRFCDYTFYSDKDMTTPVTEATADAAQTYYVQWRYTDDAPVFNSTGADVADYQYYTQGPGTNYQQVTADDVSNSSTAPTTPDDHSYHWALVGNPYSLKVYHRESGMFVTSTSMVSGTPLTATAATAADGITWDMPVLTGTPGSQEFSLRTKGLSFYWNGNALGASQTHRLHHIVVPLKVYKADQTTLADHLEYLLSYPNASSAAFNASALTSGSLGNQRHQHAFCDYTYYKDEDFLLRVPTSGLSYFGGQDQERKAVWATYSVDEQFYEPWLLFYEGGGHESSPYFAYLDGNDRQSAKQMSGDDMTETKAIDIAREDKSKELQWQFLGDPYNFQMVNVKKGEGYPLGAKQTTSGSAAVNADLNLYASDNSSTYPYNTWELMENVAPDDSDKGQYYFYVRHDGMPRLTSGFWGFNPIVVSSTSVQPDIYLIPAVAQYNIKWQIVDGRAGKGNALVTSEVTKHVRKDRVLTLADMPTGLMRHFCEYDYMYSGTDNGSAASLAQDITAGLTVTAPATIYVPYTLGSGAPRFVDAPVDDDKYWYEMHYLGEDNYLNTDGNAVGKTTMGGVDYTTVTALREDGTNYPKHRWQLVGSPYAVKFYNKEAEKYITADASPATVGTVGTTFELLDDATGDFCAIHDPETFQYVNGRGLLQTYISGWISAEFSNSYGLSELYLVLHYSDKTLRRLDTNSDDVLDTDAAGQTETIHLTTFQASDKRLIDVLPTEWKRAYCEYKFWWNTSTTGETYEEAPEATTVSDDMVEYYKTPHDVYVHVTYEVKSPFKWSTATESGDGKYWYYWVNHNIHGASKGTMNYTASDNWFRQNEGLYDDRFYTNNYEWCVMGDPYGFRMLCYYDPDRKFNEYVEVSDRPHPQTGDAIIDCDVDGGSAQTLFEMRLSSPKWTDYFWMHPIYNASLMDESDELGGYSYVRADGLASSHVLLDKKSTYSNQIRSTNISNFTLMPLTSLEMEEHLFYKGFVNGLSNDAVAGYAKTFTIPGESEPLTLAQIFTKVKARRDAISTGDDYENYTPFITREVSDSIHSLLFSDGGQVQMQEGYYRIVPYNYERYSNLSGTEAGGRHYVRGYLYGNGTTGYDNERTDAASGGYADRWELTTGDNATTTQADGAVATSEQKKTLMLNETVQRAEYDPASIFYFRPLTNAGGYTRYAVGTQGLWLSGQDGAAKMYVQESEAYTGNGADHVRFESVGSVISQLRLAHGNASEYDYLSYVQNFSSNEPENARRAALRKDFASYNFTRFYLQPVGATADNLMPLKVEIYPGNYIDEETKAMGQYYFSTLYVPYDVVIQTEGAYAYVGKKINAFGDLRRLECQKVPAFGTYEAGKFVPGGTPVVLRVDATNAAGNVDAFDMDGYDRENGVDGKTHYILLGLPTTTPTDNSYISDTFLQGSYLEQVIVPGDDVYVLGQGTEQDYVTETTDEVGFYKNKNTRDASTDYNGTDAQGDKRNNHYVRHNKVYVLASDLGLTDSPSREFVGVTFGETGIDDVVPAQPMHTAAIYDLQGRQVATEQEARDGSWERTAKPGVYIQNGRKFVKK